MSWLTEGLQNLQTGIKDYQSKINATDGVGDFFTNTGQSFEDAYKAAPGSRQLKLGLFDPSRDTGPNALRRQAEGLRLLSRGEDPFNQEAGDTEYNRDVARRAAIVAAAVGGGLAYGAYGAGTAAAPVATTTAAPIATTTVAPVATTGAATTTGGASVAPTTAYGVGAGNTSGLGVGLGGNYAAGSASSTGVGTGGAATYGLGEGGASLASASPMTTGGMYAGAGLGGSNLGMQAGMGGMPGGAASPATSSWMPYAQAGGSILSTLFQGLLQMERDREQNVQNIRAKQAEANIQRSALQNQALDRLMQVWRR